MHLLVILAHPDPTSLNHAIARTVVDQLGQNGHIVILHDLYAEQFDPVLASAEMPKEADLPQSLRVHCEELERAEGIVIVHPNWWGQPPAILKGWVDRVIRPGRAYAFEAGDAGEGVPKGLLRAKAAVVFNTSNTMAEREMQVFGDPLETTWRNCIFALCGVHTFYRRMFGVVVTSTERERKQWLAEARAMIDTVFPSENQTG